MCLGLPLRVETLEDEGAAALCVSRDGSHREVLDLRLVGPQEPGTWVLGFLGAARSVMTEAEAHQTADALEAIAAVQRGEGVDHLFADLVGREPELPDFLKTQG